MDTLREAIYKNMGNAKLKMDDLGADMGISRVQALSQSKGPDGQVSCGTA